MGLIGKRVVRTLVTREFVPDPDARRRWWHRWITPTKPFIKKTVRSGYVVAYQNGDVLVQYDDGHLGWDYAMGLHVVVE